MHHFPGISYYDIRDKMSWNVVSLLAASVPSYGTKAKDGKGDTIHVSSKAEEIASLKNLGIIK